MSRVALVFASSHSHLFAHPFLYVTLIPSPLPPPLNRPPNSTWARRIEIEFNFQFDLTSRGDASTRTAPLRSNSYGWRRVIHGSVPCCVVRPVGVRRPTDNFDSNRKPQSSFTPTTRSCRVECDSPSCSSERAGLFSPAMPLIYALIVLPSAVFLCLLSPLCLFVESIRVPLAFFEFPSEWR